MIPAGSAEALVGLAEDSAGLKGLWSSAKRMLMIGRNTDIDEVR